MTAENLLIGLIVLIYIVSFILKKRRVVSQSEDSQTVPQKSGWRAKLDQFVARMQQEIDTAKPEGDNEPIGWEELMAAERDAEIRGEAQLVGAGSSESASTAADSAAEPRPPQAIRPEGRGGGKAPLSVATATASVSEHIPPGLRPPERRRTGAGSIEPPGVAIGRSGLRSAVVWSEILAPPMALRDL